MIPMLLKNKYPGYCSFPSCRKSVPVGEGFVRKENGYWKHYCPDHAPEQLPSETPAPVARKLTAAGEVFTPYEPQNLPLLRAFPGARWNGDRRCWVVSLAEADRERVLGLADRLGLDVDPSLRAVRVTEQAAEASLEGLYPFQVRGVDFLAKGDRRLLADDPGLGKTCQTLKALPKNSRTVAVVPAVVKYNWKAECERWRPDLAPVVLDGRGTFRLPKPGELIIVNYDLLPDWLIPGMKILLGFGKSARFAGLPEAEENLLEEGERVFLTSPDYWCPSCEGVGCKTCKDSGVNKKPQKKVQLSVPSMEILAGGSFSGLTLVVDEGHKTSNRKSLRSQKVKVLSGLSEKVFVLTGTPLLNHPDQLYGMMEATGMAERVFGHFGKFMRLFHAEKDRWGGIQWGSPAPEVPELLRRVMLRRTREEVLPDLPSKTYTDLTVNGLPSRLRKKLDDLEEEWGGFLEVGDELPPFEEFSAVRAELAASRTEAVLEYVEDCEEQGIPLIVASAHRAPVDALENRDGWATITGSTPPEKRTEIVAAFQAGSLKGVGLTIQAGGVGITLTRAWRMLFVDLDWTPANNLQCEDRICRIGQTSSKVEIVRMVSDHPLDQHVQKLIARKVRMIELAVEKTVRAVVPVPPKEGADGEAKAGETEAEFRVRQEKIRAAEEEYRKNKEEMDKAKAKEVAAEKARRVREREARKAEADGRKLLPLTPERAEAVRRAFGYMLGVCDGAVKKDGQGFNKPDAAVAHMINPSELAGEVELEAALLMLTRYARQLKNREPLLFGDGK
jgi:hypothetical protein